MPINFNKLYNQWGKIVAGIKPFKNPNNWPIYNSGVDEDAALIYNGNGSTGGVATSAIFGQGDRIVSTVGNLVKSGYTFKEWNTNANGTGTAYLPGSTITVGFSSITLYAIWTSNVVIAPENAFILRAQLLTGQVINGTIGTSTGYYRILYWDGTSEILPSGTTYQKTNTSTPDGTMASYGPKTIKIWSCDQNGNVTGYISNINLENDKYLAFTLEKVTKLTHLTVKNNTVITASDLDFTLLTDILSITLDNLQSFTGAMTLFKETILRLFIPNWVNPTFIQLNGTTTTNRSLWNSPHYVSKSLSINNLPITSLDLGGHDGITRLNVTNCPNLTNINTIGCENLDSIDYRNNTALVSSNFQQPYLNSVTVIDSPIYTSNLLLSSYLRSLYLKNVGVTSLDLSNLTSLLDLSLEDMTQMDNTAIYSLHNDLFNTLTTLSLKNVTCPFIDLVSFGELVSVTLHNLPDVTAFNLPNSINTVDMYRLAGVIPAEVDTLLVGLDTSGIINGTLRRTQFNSTDLLRTHASDTALANLISKGWNLANEGYSGEMTLSGL
jgi:hypothetical protein